MSQAERILARDRLERAHGQVPDLLAGPNEPTTAYEDWTVTIKRALRLGLGEGHALVMDFETLAMVHRAAGGQIGVPGGFRTFERRAEPHQVLRRGREIIDEALALLAQGEASAPTAHQQQVQVSPAVPGSGDYAGDHPKALISYAWESEEHKKWVLELATELRRRGVDIILDRWQVHPGDQLPEFMERAIRESEFVLIVCIPTYKAKSEERAGGVGYEGNIMTAELFARNNQRKYIPLLRQAGHGEALPNWLAGKRTLDLRGAGFGADFEELVQTLRRERGGPPPLGPAPVRAPTPEAVTPRTLSPVEAAARTKLSSKARKAAPTAGSVEDDSAPVRIVGVIEDEIGTPRMDGTRGSALYEVPFRLSRTPDFEWERLFIEAWNHPPSFTSMHRPGIARVDGDRIVLDGTTVEEVLQYHRDTLQLAVQVANQQLNALITRRRHRDSAQQAQREQHERAVREQAKHITFD